MSETLRAPFPWFGGKSKVSEVVWKAFGNVPNYVEPFFGSGAVLLGRPGGAGKIETVNDYDCHLANFWRAIQADPDAVAYYCDWPINELDLHARHRYLVDHRDELRVLLTSDPDAFDAKHAGWWCWGICQWIGGGWCSPSRDGRLLQKRPAVASAGGVHLATHLPAIGNDRGINGVSAPPCREWFRDLQGRLRRVRVVCGDWSRVLGDGTVGKGETVGGRRPCAVFLDPPYSHEFRDPALYSEDDAKISEQVRQWAVEHGDDPELRLALCGYAGEHEMPGNWTTYTWTGGRGYAGKTNTNREQERIWFSPHCLSLESRQRQLFGTG